MSLICSLVCNYMKVVSLIDFNKFKLVIESVVLSLGFSLYWVRISRTRGRAGVVVYVDGKVTADDCGSILKQLQYVARVEGFDLAYVNIEVSSPGIQRQLFCVDHYKACIGCVVLVKLYELCCGKRNVKGVIESVCGDMIKVSSDLGSFEFCISNVKTANLVFDFKEVGIKNEQKCSFAG